MSQNKRTLTVKEVSYSWTDKDKTEFVLHHNGTGIVQGFVGQDRNSFSIEIDGKGRSTYRRMKDAKEAAALLWAKGQRVHFAGGRPVVKSSSVGGRTDQTHPEALLTREQSFLQQGSYTADAFPHLHNGGVKAPPKRKKTGLAEYIAEVKPEALCAEYMKLIECAPRRSVYFGEHTGVPSGTKKSNRYEEHLEMALWNLRGSWPPPEYGPFSLLDYQFPLQASRADKDIGEIDLLGLTENGRLMIIEMKVDQLTDSNNETPMAALMQGLRYAAIVQANQERIAKEAESHCNVSVATEDPPVVQILAPEAWWRSWMQPAASTRRALGNWELAFGGLASRIEKQVGVSIEWAALKVERKHLCFGGDGQPPRLKCVPRLRYLCLGAH